MKKVNSCTEEPPPLNGWEAILISFSVYFRRDSGKSLSKYPFNLEFIMK